jgi:hypothetical protein
MDMNPSFWEIIDNYIRFIKVNNISPRKDLQKLIFKLNEAETNFNNQLNAGKHDEAKKLLQSRITILTAYAG